MTDNAAQFGENSYMLGPPVEGAPPIQLSGESLTKAKSTAARWRCSGYALDGVNAALMECFGHGLIGVSPPMLKVIEACAEEVHRETPVLLSGEPGTELEPAAKAVHALTYGEAAELPTLRCSGLTDEVLQRPDIWRGRATAFSNPISKLDQLLGVVEPDDVLLTDIECAPLSVQAKFVSALNNRGTPRVLATTHEPITALEHMADDRRLLRELLQRLRNPGRVIEVPPLFMRPEDLPLLIYCCVERYNRGAYGEPKVRAVAAEWLYFAASRRWRLNLDELERSVIEACRRALSIDGTIRCFQPGEDTLEQVDWPEDCPFGLSWPSYRQAQHDLKKRGEVAIEDLPGYDLKGLLEAVDTHVDPADRGHWTIEARRRYLQSEHHGRPPEEGLAAIEVTSDKAAVERPAVIPFPTPKGATWSQVELRLKDGESLSVKVREKRGVYNYTQMGMVSLTSGRPTVQWDLLKAFALEHGTLTWASSFADRKNQKRRERLSRDLQKFFLIEGDPIKHEEKGWRTYFRIDSPL